uniref:Uncharacterized protein n=1 Tax=Anguilla anguilla TaxID=7936 RepID=A0A0E9TQ73_ANGAN
MRCQTWLSLEIQRKNLISQKEIISVFLQKIRFGPNFAQMVQIL